MSLTRIVVVVGMTLCTLPGAADRLLAQEATDSDAAAATAAALRHIRDDLRREQGIAPESVVVNSRMLSRANRQDANRDAIPLASLAVSLGLRSGPGDQYITCEAGSGSCRLKGASAVIAISPPGVEGDSARLIASVETEYCGGLGQTLGRTTFELILSRSQQGWTVVRKIGRSVT